MTPSHRSTLIKIARRAMLEKGLQPDFSPAVFAELDRLHGPAPLDHLPIRDLRELLWCSIDNDDSLDLDQLSAAEEIDRSRVKIRVAIADVDSLVPKGSEIDQHASLNTTSVYTPAVIFPMLPEKLSTHLTSLNLNQDRLAMVVEMTVNGNGSLQDADVYRAVVRSHAKLAYNQVAAWLEDEIPVPEEIARVPGLAENLRLQDKAAQELKKYRHANGALTLETIEAHPVFKGSQVSSLDISVDNRATEMIENFMITANGVTARFLASKNYPSIRRVVLAPRRWDRIVAIAEEYGEKLPGAPDSIALEEFLVKQKAARPQQFTDLSLAVIKLIGPGEYVAEPPGDPVPDHFSLAAKDYTHSTAPNRRYTDLITQRLLKASLSGLPSPYSLGELTALAEHCTIQEDEANKVERQVDKSAAALLLQSKIGETFDALVTGASPKGTWVRLVTLPIEGRLVTGFQGLDVGYRVRVQLDSVDVEQGFIDFGRVKPTKH